MRCSIVSAAVLALASSVVAQTSGFDAITAPTQDQQIAAGSNFTIVWTPSPGGYDNDTISITLLYGTSASTLQLAPTPIASNISNYLGSYTYLIPATGLYPTYGFKLALDFDPTIFQYSFPFHITGGASSSLSGTATSTLTQTVAPGPSYTSSVTNSSTVIASTTSSSSMSTIATPSSNLTTSVISKTTTAATKTASSSGSSTSTAAATSSSSAAIANAVTGGLAAFGGLVLAFAL